MNVVVDGTDWTSALLNAAVVLVAAVIGLIGPLVNRSERRQRRQERSQEGFIRLMAAIGQQALRADERLSTPRVSYAIGSGQVTGKMPKDRNSETGGPLDVDVQTAADMAIMDATPTDRPVAIAVAETLFHFKRALVSWQISRYGEVVGDIRKWNTMELSDAEFIAKVVALKDEIVAGEAARAQRART